MLQSRSQTKIKKMRELNLLAEQRYLSSKKILNEGIEEDLQKCFGDAGIDFEKIPPACISTDTKPDVIGCVTGLIAVVSEISTEKRTDFKTCTCDVISKNFGDQTDSKSTNTIKTFCGTLGDMINTGVDILKGGIGGIFGGGSNQ